MHADPKADSGGRDHPGERMDPLGRMVRTLLDRPGVCRLAGSVLPEVLTALAGEGPIGKKLSRVAGRCIRSACHARARLTAQKEPGTIRQDAALAMDMGGVAVHLLNHSMAAFSQLPNREKKALLDHMVERLDTAGMGRALTDILQVAQDGAGSRDLLREKLSAFLEATDFGEVTDAAAGARDRLLPVWEEALDVLWSYPSKVVCLLAALPPLAGLAANAGARGLAPFNQLPPDMLVDVIVSLIHDLDGKAVGALVNQGTELVRKLHVGSTLIGDPGRPALPLAVERLMQSVLDAVDLDALATARLNWSQLADAMAGQQLSCIEQRPEWNRAGLQADLGFFSFRARVFSRRVNRWESLPDEALAQAVADGLSDLDAGELADACNRCLDLAGRVMDIRPDLMPNLFGAFVEEIDLDAIAHCLATVFLPGETGNRFDDFAAPLIHGLADRVDADPDSELAGALRRLGGIICG
jgi:hypothetical protein